MACTEFSLQIHEVKNRGFFPFLSTEYYLNTTVYTELTCVSAFCIYTSKEEIFQELIKVATDQSHNTRPVSLGK